MSTLTRQQRLLLGGAVAFFVTFTSWHLMGDDARSTAALLPDWGNQDTAPAPWDGQVVTAPVNMDSCVPAELDSSTILEDRHNASFWSASIELPYIIVSPRNHEQWRNCPDDHRQPFLDALRDATFTGRLHFGNETRLLEEPNQIETSVYRFGPVVAPIQNHEDQLVTVEISLELAWYPSDPLPGQPCGDDVHECSFDELAEKGIKWSGQSIMDQDNNMPSYQNLLPSLLGDRVEEELPLCDYLGNLRGSWIQNSTYLPLNVAGAPCRLLEMGAPPGLAPRTWIRFVGDSNMRNAFKNYSAFVGADRCTKQSPYPNRQLCWSDQILISFYWFYQQSGRTQLTPRQTLGRILPQTIPQFLQGNTWLKDEETWPAAQWSDWEGPPNRTYISLGSHAANETTLGTQHLLDDCESLFLTQHTLPGLRFVKTSAAMTKWLARTIWKKQMLLENNVHIGYINRVLENFARGLNIPVIDLFNPVRAAVPYMYDALHQKQEMYRIWTRLYHTDLFGESGTRDLEDRTEP